jgi:hypothetical protein
MSNKCTKGLPIKQALFVIYFVTAAGIQPFTLLQNPI